MDSVSALADPLTWGGFLGMVAVGIGAFGAHGLEGKVSPDQLEIFNTGARYHLIHSTVLVTLGVLETPVPERITASFIFGILIFSGSLYGIVLTGISRLGMITPIGGTLLILAWAQVGFWSLFRSL